MPQKVCEGGIFHVRAMHIFPEMPQNRTYSFSVLFQFSESDRKNGAFQEKRTKKARSRKKHVINFKTRKEPKMNMFDFGAFQEKMLIPSRAKYTPRILFGSYQDTPVICLVKFSLLFSDLNYE